MLQHLQAFVSAGSQQKTVSFPEVLVRATVVALGIAFVLLAITGVGYLLFKGLTEL